MKFTDTESLHALLVSFLKCSLWISTTSERVKWTNEVTERCKRRKPFELLKNSENLLVWEGSCPSASIASTMYFVHQTPSSTLWKIPCWVLRQFCQITQTYEILKSLFILNFRKLLNQTRVFEEWAFLFQWRIFRNILRKIAVDSSVEGGFRGWPESVCCPASQSTNRFDRFSAKSHQTTRLFNHLRSRNSNNVRLQSKSCLIKAKKRSRFSNPISLQDSQPWKGRFAVSSNVNANVLIVMKQSEVNSVNIVDFVFLSAFDWLPRRFRENKFSKEIFILKFSNWNISLNPSAILSIAVLKLRILWIPSQKNRQQKWVFY